MSNVIRRHFRLLSNEDLHDPELLAAANEIHGLGGEEWQTLLALPRVLILAEAGAGKTHELNSCRDLLVREGGTAFFLPLETLAQEDIAAILSPADNAALADWKEHDGERAWFFLDSVDEMKLSRGRFDRALQRLASALDGALHRASIIVTSRPSDWRPRTDLETFQRTLPVPSAPVADGGSEDDFMSRLPGDKRDQSDGDAAISAEPTKPGTVQSYMLLPLSEQQIESFAQKRKIADADAFVAAIAAEDAWLFARRPLDLIDLIEVWREHGRLGSRREQIETNITIKLRDKHLDDVLSEAKARDGASRLALALTLTRKRTLRTGEARLEPGDDAALLDPAAILPNWRPNELASLLRRAMFDPATYGRVRFHHRSVVEYLAAERLRRLHEERNLSRGGIVRLLFAQQYGVDVVLPSMRPVAAWLATWMEAIRTEVMRREPELLLLEGDAGSLTIEDRVALIHRINVVHGGGGWRRLQIPRDASRRFACAELVPAIRAVWNSRPENPEVSELLLELIWLGNLRSGTDIALEAALDTDQPYLNRVFGIRALAEADDTVGLRAFVETIVTDPVAADPHVVYGSLALLFPGHLDVAELLGILAAVPAPNDSTTFPTAMRQIAIRVDPLSIDATVLRDGLADLIIEAFSADSNWWEFKTARPMLAEPLALITWRQAAAAVTPDAAMLRAALFANQFTRHDYSDDKIVDALRHWVADAEPEVRERAFWVQDDTFHSAFPTEPSDRLFRAARYGLINVPEARDGEWLRNCVRNSDDHAKREIAVHALITEWHRSGRSRLERYRLLRLTGASPDLSAIVMRETAPRDPMPAWANHAERERRAKVAQAAKRAAYRAKWRSWRLNVLADPDGALAPGEEERTLARLVNWLRGRSDSAWSRRDVAKAFGDQLADRFAAALIRYWQERTARSNAVITSTDAGLSERERTIGFAGLAALAEQERWALALDPVRAKSAALFGLRHANQFPAWFGNLAEDQPDVVREIVGSAACRDLRRGSSLPHLGILQHVRYSPMSVKRLVIPNICQALERWPRRLRSAEVTKWWSSHLSYVLGIIAEAGSSDQRRRAAEVCCERLKLVDDPKGAIEWLSGLFKFDGALGIDAMIALISKSKGVEQANAAVGILAMLDRGRRAVPLVFDDDATRAASLLKAVRFTFRAVHPQTDPERSGSHSVGDREEAEMARDYFVSALFSTPGSHAWQALMDLSEEPEFAHFPDRLRQIARERAAKDADGVPLGIDDVIDLERRAEATPHNRDTMFELTRERLEELQALVSHDDFTNRVTLRRVHDETEMQANLAGHLRNLARSAYHVVREEEVADGKKTDIRLLATRSELRSVIEVKMADDRWSAMTLRRALELQLVQMYLRHDRCRAGFLLLVVDGSRTSWRLSQGVDVDLDGLLVWLREECHRLMARDGFAYRIDALPLVLSDPVVIDPHRRGAKSVV